jgi:hypothetical protein
MINMPYCNEYLMKLLTKWETDNETEKEKKRKLRFSY